MVRSGLVKMVYKSIKQILIKNQQAYLFNKSTSIVALKKFLAQTEGFGLINPERCGFLRTIILQM